MKLNKQNLTKKLGYTSVQADWYLKMMVQIVIDEDGTVDARKLHEVLEVKSRYNDWINNRISKYGFIENVDYTKILVQCKRGQNEYTHKLTSNMAKELSMIENNEQGKEFRKYFIMAEEIANKILSWELERADNVVAHGKMISAYKQEYMGKHNGRQPKGWMYGQLQNDVYWVVFGVDGANSIKQVLEIKHYESVPANVQERIEKALTYVYNTMTFLIEMGMLEDREARVYKLEEMFDKKFGGIIQLEE